MEVCRIELCVGGESSNGVSSRRCVCWLDYRDLVGECRRPPFQLTSLTFPSHSQQRTRSPSSFLR